MRKVLPVISVIIVLLFSACTKTEDKFSVDNMRISIELESESVTERIYDLNITNNNDALIKCVDVGMGFDYLIDESSKDLMFDAVFKGLIKYPDIPINIAKGETVSFEIHIPIAIIKEGSLDFDEPVIMVNGFYEKIDIEHQFTLYGSFEGGLVNKENL